MRATRARARAQAIGARTRLGTSLWAAGPGALVLLLGHVTGTQGQGADALAARCVTRGGQAVPCVLAVAAARDLPTDVGLLVGSGSAVPGQGSALGRRLGGMPRFAPFARVGGHAVRASDFTDLSGASDETPFVPALSAGIGFGVFDGFRLLPTVGGFLSIDLVGEGSFVFFPEAQGFGGRLDALSLGARLGILRESFTLPGVTLSYARRLSGSVRYGAAAAGDAAEVEVDPTVDAWRAAVSKDLFAFGLLAGVGWDDVSADVSIRATDGAGGFVSDAGELVGTRRTYFFGFSRQLGVLSWLSGELGWVEPKDPVAAAGASSPERGRTYYGSLAVLVKL